MTQKGRIFDPQKPETMPSFMRGKPLPEQTAWAEKETVRFAVVETCDQCGEPLIAEEQLAHFLNHVPSDLRSAVRTFYALTPEQRAAFQKLTKKVRYG